jgi:tRNA (cmo5U34)-methyltransferase
MRNLRVGYWTEADGEWLSGISMSVAAHLNINLDEYDARIRSFIPGYDLMIASAAESLRALPSPTPLLVDLGIGTGALSQACLAVCPQARVLGIDEDRGMLDMARERLRGAPAVSLELGSFIDVPLPACDAIVASLALHHIPTADAKRTLYKRCHDALRPGGLLVSADCFPAANDRLAQEQREAWLVHLQLGYSRQEAEAFLSAWAKEDTYVPLNHELAWLKDTGFETETMYRSGCFGVVTALKL